MFGTFRWSRSTRPGQWTAALTLLILVPLSASAGEVVQVDGVPHVRNAAVPAEGVQTQPLTELWRVGGEDEEVFFGTIFSVLTDQDGNVYLLDGQLNQIEVYSPGGEHLRTLGREGEGPGEVRRAQDRLNLPGGRIRAVEQIPGKIVAFERDGSGTARRRPTSPRATPPPAGWGFCGTSRAAASTWCCAGREYLLPLTA